MNIQKKLCPICGKVSIFECNKMCFYCYKKQYNDRIKWAIESGRKDSTQLEADIYCPWCGEMIEFENDANVCTKGKHNRKCPYCEKVFTINTRVSFNYDTWRFGK